MSLNIYQLSTCSHGSPSFAHGAACVTGGTNTSRLIQHGDGSLELPPKSLAWVVGEKIAPLAHKCLEFIGDAFRYIQKGVHAVLPALPSAEAYSVGNQGLSSSKVFPLPSLQSTQGVIFTGSSAQSIAMADFNADGYADVAIMPYPGDLISIYVIYGRENLHSPFNITTLDGTNGIRIVGNITSHDCFSVPCSMATGDINGDRVPDLVINVSNNLKSVRVFVVYGGKNLTHPTFLDRLSKEEGTVIMGPSSEPCLGSDVTTGQLNADRYDDIVIGRGYFDNCGGTTNPAGYIFFGGPDLPPVNWIDRLTPTTGCIIENVLPQDTRMGVAVRTRHVAGRILDDLIVGMPAAPVVSPPEQLGPGRVYIIYGKQPFPFHLRLAELNRTTGAIFAPAAGTTQGLGDSIAVGNVHGGPLSDVLIGHNAAPSGFYLLYGSRTLPFSFGTEILDGKMGINITLPSSTYFGPTTPEIGDWNGDGISDMLIPDRSHPSVYLIYGSRHFPQTLLLSSLNEQSGVVFQGDMHSSSRIDALAIGADVNGDGFGDCAIGTNRVVYLVYGQETPPPPEPDLTLWKVAAIIAGLGGCVLGGIVATASTCWYFKRKARQEYAAMN